MFIRSTYLCTAAPRAALWMNPQRVNRMLATAMLFSIDSISTNPSRFLSSGNGQVFHF